MSRKDADRRVAEALSGAGVRGGTIATEVLLLLPEPFVEAYERLYHSALMVEPPGRGVQGSGGETGVRAPGGGRKGPRGWAVRSEAALGVKGWADQQLRKLARDLQGRLDRAERGGDSGTALAAACGKCGRFMQGEWRFCPRCGSRAVVSGDRIEMEEQT